MMTTVVPTNESTHTWQQLKAAFLYVSLNVFGFGLTGLIANSCRHLIAINYSGTTVSKCIRYRLCVNETTRNPIHFCECPLIVLDGEINVNFVKIHFGWFIWKLEEIHFIHSMLQGESVISRIERVVFNLIYIQASSEEGSMCLRCYQSMRGPNVMIMNMWLSDEFAQIHHSSLQRFRPWIE